MTIFFLGTSNCVVHGSFVETVRAGTDEAVVNASVGSCSSGVGLYLLHDIAPQPGDVAILDYTITDTLFMLQNVRTAAEIRAYMDALVAPLLAAGCTPIIAINVLRDHLEGTMPARDVHLALCRAQGLAYVDHVRLLRRALARGAPIDLLMADSAHFTREAHAILGRALLGAIRRVRRLSSVPPRALRSPWATRRVEARAIAAPAHVRRGTRLRSAELAVLREGDRTTLPVGGDERLIGIMVNMAAAGAKVRISGGDTTIVANMEYEWDNLNPHAFMSLFVEFRHYMRGSAEGIALEILPQHAVATEPFHPRPPIAGCYGTIQIEGVLAGKPCETAPAAAPAYAIDLHARRYEALAAELAAIDGRRELAA